jgi:hypothetical protein
MDIARERFLDASRDLHLTLSLRSRSTRMHSVLTALTVAHALARALDEIEQILAPHLDQPDR